MRIVAGSAKGRRLEVPRRGTRPLTGRAREALFSILGPRAAGAAVVDLFAGSGALGLEALSRGASHVVFVESDREAAEVLRRNVTSVGLGGRVQRSTVERFLAADRGRYDLAFLDPPFSLALASVAEVLGALVPRLRPGATVVVHRRTGEEPPEVTGLAVRDRRRYGDSELWIYEKEDG